MNNVLHSFCVLRILKKASYRRKSASNRNLIAEVAGKRYSKTYKEEIMKISTQQITFGEDEILIKYKEMTPGIEKIIESLKREQFFIIGKRQERQYRLSPRDIFYFESVDDKLFAYTSQAEYQVMLTLSEAGEKFGSYGFFRCNKSFVVNINHIASVRSEMGNRIDALLDNQEHVIISRRYAKDFRELLRGGKENE